MQCSNNKGGVVLTVGLPIWKSTHTVELALESLARQKDVNFDWELVVAEEEDGA